MREIKMTKEEFNLLFHKAQLNLVAFKPVMDCYPELQIMVELAIQQEREACAQICEEAKALRLAEIVRSRGE